MKEEIGTGGSRRSGFRSGTILIHLHINQIGLTHMSSLLIELNDVKASFVLALRCKHCEEFYSNKKDVKSIEVNGACRECDANDGMASEQDTF